MGTYVNLSILPSEISSQQWEEVFNESLQLLEASAFADVKEREYYGRKLPVYIKAAVKNDPSTHWRCNGDLESRRYAETFTLYKNISAYQTHSNKANGKDILFEKDTEKIVDIFDSKTQGHPYHLDILAVAMLIESRFPNHALVGGNIDYKQCVKAREWANEHLSKPIDLPVRVEPKALLSRFSNQNDTKSIEFLEEWLIADQEKLFEYIHRNANKEAWQHWFIQKLKSYNSPNQLGALKLFINYLNTIKDIDKLAELACKTEDGPKFSPSEFIVALAGTWIYLPRNKFSFLAVFNRVEGHPVIVERQFGTLMLDMKFTGREINTYLPLKKLARQLTNLFPEVNESIENLLKQKLTRIEQELELFHTMIKPILEKYEADTEETIYLADDDAFLYFDDDAVKLSEEQGLKLQSVAFSIKYFYQGMEDNLAEKLNNETLKSLKHMLVKIMDEKFDMIITEYAFDWILNTEDKRLIKVLIGKLMVDNFMESHHEKREYEIRKAMFENKTITERIAAYMDDEDKMKEMEALMERK